MKKELQNKKISIGILIFGVVSLIISNNTKYLKRQSYYILDDYGLKALGMRDYNVDFLWFSFSYETIFIFTILIIALATYLLIYKDDLRIKEQSLKFRVTIRKHFSKMAEKSFLFFNKLKMGFFNIVKKIKKTHYLFFAITLLIVLIVAYYSDKLYLFYEVYHEQLLKVLGFTFLIGIFKILFSKKTKVKPESIALNADKKQNPFTKKMFFIILLLLLITVIVSYLNYYPKSNVVEYKGVSFKVPKGWGSKKKSIYDGDAFQINLKNLNSSVYEGQVATISNYNLDSYYLNDLKKQYLESQMFRGLKFYSVEDNEYRGIECKVLPYTYLENDKKMYGEIFQFNYKSKFFSIDLKMDEAKDDDFEFIESSFLVES